MFSLDIQYVCSQHACVCDLASCNSFFWTAQAISFGTLLGPIHSSHKSCYCCIQNIPSPDFLTISTIITSHWYHCKFPGLPAPFKRQQHLKTANHIMSLLCCTPPRALFLREVRFCGIAHRLSASWLRATSLTWAPVTLPLVLLPPVPLAFCGLIYRPWPQNPPCLGAPPLGACWCSQSPSWLYPRPPLHWGLPQASSASSSVLLISFSCLASYLVPHMLY